jgi:hypothetical protein
MKRLLMLVVLSTIAITFAACRTNEEIVAPMVKASLDEATPVSLDGAFDRSKTLISGRGGAGARDGATKFSIDGGVTFAPAYIVPTSLAWSSIEGSMAKWISATENTVSIPPYPQTTIYRREFSLPATFADVSLTISLLADNQGIVYLNGYLVGSQPCCPGSNFNAAATVFVDADASHFKKDKNIIEIHVVDYGVIGDLIYEANADYVVNP